MAGKRSRSPMFNSIAAEIGVSPSYNSPSELLNWMCSNSTRSVFPRKWNKLFVNLPEFTHWCHHIGELGS